MKGKPIIQLKNLTKTFGEVEALKNLDLDVHENSIYGFLGPNGAGKSTTIKLLLGLIRPTNGSIKIFGKNIKDESIQIRSKIGYLPQSPRFYNHMTAEEILRFTIKFYFKGPESKINERIDNLLDIVSLTGKADRSIKGFSGGERQRLGIAQAMINFPDLLILDEPAAALDPIGRKDVLQIMEDLKDYTTIFYSTHILDDVQRTSDMVAILNNGKLIAEGPIEDLLTGTDGIVYKVNLSGDIDTTEQQLRKINWIKDLNTSTLDNGQSWNISVEDEDVAEENLLRIILENPNIRVKHFSKMKYELEDVFMRMVE